jgi:hypothetical protein
MMHDPDKEMKTVMVNNSTNIITASSSTKLSVGAASVVFISIFIAN